MVMILIQKQRTCQGTARDRVTKLQANAKAAGCAGHQACYSAGPQTLLAVAANLWLAPLIAPASVRISDALDQRGVTGIQFPRRLNRFLLSPLDCTSSLRVSFFNGVVAFIALLHNNWLRSAILFLFQK